MIHIVYNNYLNSLGKELTVGGIQTYITNLLSVLDEIGERALVHQRANIDFCHEYGNHKIIGHAVQRDWKENYNLLKETLKFIDKSKDLVIFGCETCAVFNPGVPAIGIQHGVSWDKPDYRNSRGWREKCIFLRKIKWSLDLLRRLSYQELTVCVDYNFVNWYRAIVPFPHYKQIVIPNFTPTLETFPIKDEDNINIIFARRFFDYRGTRIFADAFSRILKEYPNVHLTVAGEGPDEPYLREKLTSPQTEFIKYDSKNSLDIHRSKHIAIIPTLGSEGTSLSLLEAMACGCAPICTNVGGMTNIVIDHYNGLMINPSTDDLYNASKILLNDSKLRNDLAQKAYETISSAFSVNRWKDSWKSILSNWINSHNERR